MIKSKWMGAIPKKKKKKNRGWRVLRIYFSENPPGIFRFVTTKFWRKLSPLAGNSAKLCGTPWIFQHPKPRPIKIPHDLFLNTPGNSISLLIGAWGIFTSCSSFSIPLEIHVLNPLALPAVWIFSGIIQ